MSSNKQICGSQFANISFEDGIERIYNRLYEVFGSQDWWPGDSPFEIIIGAILTQAVNWRNVEMAITNLKENNLLNPAAIAEINQEQLAELIIPTGYYNMKARKLKVFVRYLFDNYQGDIELMFSQPLSKLRKELLGVYGIGPETADSILLYAGNYPVFVIDAYTRRILGRIGYIKHDITYDKLQQKLIDNLPVDVDLYNEYHALLVKLGKDVCRKNKPLCVDCPLNTLEFS